jgi:hypothetical protein
MKNADFNIFVICQVSTTKKYKKILSTSETPIMEFQVQLHSTLRLTMFHRNVKLWNEKGNDYCYFTGKSLHYPKL